MASKFDKYSIYELRILGRRVGVEKATSLKKSKLIEEIELILSHQKAPAVKKKEGRPAKENRFDFEAENILQFVNDNADMTDSEMLAKCLERLNELYAIVERLSAQVDMLLGKSSHAQELEI